MTMTVIVSILLTCYLVFQMRLVLSGGTTVELCEKSYNRNARQLHVQSQYNIGPFANLRNLLGPNVILWLLPFGFPPGDGLQFQSLLTAEAPEGSSVPRAG